MPIPQIISVDGPAASGKSTIGQKLAQYYGYLFFDTGVMYRALTWFALKNNIPIDDEKLITQLSETTQIDIQSTEVKDGRVNDVLINGLDVTWEIKKTTIDAVVSIVSAYPGVRKALSAQQRRIGLRGKVVMVGRDIGTIVLPEAEFKIYLDASLKVRAKRRWREFMERGEQVDFTTILRDMKERDRIDSTRDIAPLRPAEDAQIINTNDMNINEVFELIKKKIDNYGQESLD